MTKSKNRKQVGLYLLFTFVLSWAFMLGVIVPAALKLTPESTDMQRAAVAILEAFVMFIPAVGVVLTRLVTHDWSDCRLHLNLKGHAVPYLVGWFGPMALTIVGAVLYFLLFPSQFSLSAAAANPMLGTEAPAALNTVATVVLVLLCPLLNAINCFGEEWGWRGFLYPKMKEGHSFLRTAVLVGLIWGIWHAPIIAIGHNYQQVVGTASWPMIVAAIAAMCVLCVFLSIIFCYISQRAHSVWPAVVAHGAFNGVASIGMLYMADPDHVNAFIGPAPTGIIGALPLIIVAIYMAVKETRREKRVV